jgi:hypothetical protein
MKKIFHISLCWLQHMIGAFDICVCQWAKRPKWADDQVVTRISGFLIDVFGIKLYRMRYLGQRFTVEQVDAVLDVRMPFPKDRSDCGVVNQRMTVKNQLIGYGLMETGEMKPFDLNNELVDAANNPDADIEAYNRADLTKDRQIAS